MTSLHPSLRLVSGHSISPSEIQWWIGSGTISAANSILAYQADLVGSYAASKINLANPGTYDLTEGNGAVTWTAANGWQFAGSTWLDTGLAPAEESTMMVQYTSATVDTFVCGALDTRGYAFVPSQDSSQYIQYWSGANFTRAPKQVSGSLFLANGQPYRNAVADGAAASAWGGTITNNMQIGKMGGFVGAKFVGYVRRFAYWDTALSLTQIKAVYNLLPRVVSYDAVFFGDSVTGGSNASDAAHRWVNLVVADQSYSSFINSGLSGTTLQNTTQSAVAVVGGAVTNNGRDTYDSRATLLAPQRVFILYGLNDLRLNSAAFTTALFQNDLSEVVDLIISSGVSASNIVIGSPPYIPETSYALYGPWDGGSRVKHAAYTAACAAVATAKGTKYIDVYQWMTDNGGDTLISEVDSLHPNDAGHAQIAAAFISVL